MTEGPQSGSRRSPLRRLLWGAALVVGIGLPWLPASVVTSVYSRGFFPLWQALMVTLTGWCPVSLTGVLFVVVPLWILVAFVRSRRAKRPLRWGRIGWRWLRGLFLVWVWFLVSWGLGYRQLPIEERLGLDRVSLADRDLDEFTSRITQILQEFPAQEERDVDRAYDSVRRSMQSLIEDVEGYRPALPARPKLLPAGLLTTSGSTGVVSPFLIESHVDAALAETDRIAVGAHEFAHLCGQNGEAGADLLGIIAGLQSDDPYARYAVALRLFASLYPDLGSLRWQIEAGLLPAEVRRDLGLRAKKEREHRNEALSSARSKVYDGYLKSQGVEAGIADYRRSTMLVLRAWRAGRLVLPG